MSGRRHHLYSAAVIAENGQPVWRFVDRATMHVRPLSDAFIEDYLDAEWEQARWCVGVYRLEGPGVQLFARIDGFDRWGHAGSFGGGEGANARWVLAG